MPEGRYRPLLCLVQIAVAGEVVVLDPLADGLGDPGPLAAVMADPAVEIVLHAGRQDVAILRREWRTAFPNVFDTPVAARFAGACTPAGRTWRSCAASGGRPSRTCSTRRSRPVSRAPRRRPATPGCCTTCCGSGWPSRPRSPAGTRAR